MPNALVGNELVGNALVGNALVGNVRTGNARTGNEMVDDEAVDDEAAGDEVVGDEVVGDEPTMPGRVFSSVVVELGVFGTSKSRASRTPANPAFRVASSRVQRASSLTSLAFGASN